jgi:hypothetical protein
MANLYDKVFHGDICCVCYQKAEVCFHHCFAHQSCLDKCAQGFKDYLVKHERVFIDTGVHHEHV